MTGADGDVVLDFDGIDGTSTRHRSPKGNQSGTRRRRTAYSIKKRQASIYGNQTLNRRLGKLTKKLGTEAGIESALGSHLKSVEDNIGVDVVVYFKQLIWLSWVPLMGILLILAFVVTPQLYQRFMMGSGYENNLEFEWHNLITGMGWMINTELFQGYYTGGNIVNSNYYMPSAYILAILIAYFFYLVWIAKCHTDAWSEQYVERDARQKAKKKDKDDENAISVSAAPKIFSMWDFSVCKRSTAKVRRNIIREEILRYVQQRKKTVEDIAADRQQLVFNMCINMFLVFFVIGLSVAIWFVSFYAQLETLFVPIITSVCSFLMPLLFSVFSLFEKYAKRSTALTAGMLRQLFLQFALFSGFVFYLICIVKCDHLPSGSSFKLICDLQQRTLNESCWETWMGRQIYRWQIMDLLVLLTFSLIFYGGQKMLSMFVGAFKAPVVDIPQLLQHLMLAQSLCWFGIFFSPLIPVVMLLKLIIVFFWFRLLLTVTCRPSERPWKSRKISSFFRYSIAFCFILAFVAVIVCLLMVPRSKTCGPFRNLESPFDALPQVSNSELIKGEFGALFLTFFNTLGFKIFFTVFLIVVLLIFRRDAQQKYETMRMLRKSILMVTKDKVYYMTMLQNHAKQNPYQMIKKLPTPMHVERTPSDVSNHSYAHVHANADNNGNAGEIIPVRSYATLSDASLPPSAPLLDNEFADMEIPSHTPSEIETEEAVLSRLEASDLHQSENEAEGQTLSDYHASDQGTNDVMTDDKLEPDMTKALVSSDHREEDQASASWEENQVADEPTGEHTGPSETDTIAQEDATIDLDSIVNGDLESASNNNVHRPEGTPRIQDILDSIPPPDY